MRNKQIIITGGTGSLGEALYNEIIKQKPKRIALLTNDENQIVNFKNKYKVSVANDRLRFFLGDIREQERLKRAFYEMDYVIHCAALKHVDIGEYNPIDIVKTNIMGTKNVIEAAIDAKVKKVIVISSDKACEPVNIYGSTKLCAEKLTIDANVYSRSTKFSAIRFGNFIGSRGSVFDKLKDQLIYTITDQRMERYWIELPEAANYVLKFIKLMNGGETFIPKMKKTNLLDELKDQYWFDNSKQIVFTGIRSGEKLSEKLFSENEKAIEKKDYYVIS